jgi:hypothetical protein
MAKPHGSSAFELSFDPEGLVYDFLRLEEMILRSSTKEDERILFQVELSHISKKMENYFWSEMQKGEFEMDIRYDVNLRWVISLRDPKSPELGVTLTDSINVLGRYMAMMWFFFRKHTVIDPVSLASYALTNR